MWHTLLSSYHLQELWYSVMGMLGLGLSPAIQNPRLVGGILVMPFMIAVLLVGMQTSMQYQLQQAFLTSSYWTSRYWNLS
jgi:hypothetical protein